MEVTEEKHNIIKPDSGTYAEVLRLAYPLMISFLSFSLMGVVDVLILGAVGTPEQGGAGMGMSLSWTVISLFTGTMTVVSTFISQANGAGKQESMRLWVQTALTLIIPMTLLVWLFVPVIPWAIDLMRTDAQVQPHVVDYMNLRLLGAPFILINFTISGFLRGLADTRTPMLVTIAANLVNVVLDLLLVFGFWIIPPLGVEGAALASVLASAVGSGLYLSVYWGKRHASRYNTRQWTWPSLDRLRRFLKVGAPAGGSWFVESISWALMTIYIATIDPAGLAAHTVVFQIIHFSFLPTAALAVASSTLVGQYLGAERIDLARSSGRASMVMGVVFMGILGLIFAVFRHPILSLFSSDPQVVSLGAWLLLIAAGFQIFDALGITTSGVLRGAGDTRYPLYAHLTAAWAVFIPLIFLFGHVLGWGAIGAWIASLVFVILLSMLMLARYLGGKWTRMRVV